MKKNDALLFSIAKVNKYLGEEIERLQSEEVTVKEEIDRITNECSRKVQPLHRKRREINNQLVAYCKVYKFMEGVGKDEEAEGTAE